MKKIIKNIGAAALLLGLSISTSMAQTLIKQNTDAFPEPEKGFKKLIIEVPHSENNENKKIEFSVGKWMDVDACNLHNLTGTLHKKDLKGWGFDYFVFETNGAVNSTNMGCGDKTTRNLFVSAAPQLVPYNGRLPIVIYVPTEYDVKFKIFTSDGDQYQAAEVSSKTK